MAQNDTVRNYVKGTLVLFLHFLFRINDVGLFIMLWTPWPYATDPRRSPDLTLRTTALEYHTRLNTISIKPPYPSYLYQKEDPSHNGFS